VSERPLPRPTELSRPHWDGCRAGVLRVQRCRGCAAYVFIPQPLCTACQASDLEWVASRGEGAIYSFSVVHRAPHPAFRAPYVVAIIALDEGFEMLANVECEPHELAIGARVRVAFRALSSETSLPYFVLARESAVRAT
jgi:uncharacterized OB-fold protein